jgi:hypothetical protein
MFDKRQIIYTIHLGKGYKMEILVGYTGFVGSNIKRYHNFDALLNSKNIEDAFGLNPDLCIYAGVPAEKYLANSNPASDLAIIEDAINNIKMINPSTLVLISTIDVYPHPYNVDELSEIDTAKAHPYGLHRFYLERWVNMNIHNHLIIRLPALFGNNIKKNFIYDIIHLVPSMLKTEKYEEFSKKDRLIKESYVYQGNGFYKCIAVGDQLKVLKNSFLDIGFTALNFTDSRSIFQFYNLNYLWEHITIALENQLPLVNLAVEPICAEEVYQAVRNEKFINETTGKVVKYNIKTRYTHLLGGSEGYIFRKNKVLSDIKKYIEEQTL